MKKLINLLRGYAEIRADGPFVERLLNLCAQHRVQFWRLAWLEETAVAFRVAVRDLARLEELAGRAGCRLQVRARKGLGAAWRGLRRRWGFLVGLAVCLAAVSILSRFVLVVEVKGNDTVPTALILSELQRLGVRPGAYGPDIDTSAVANEALIHLPQLSFLAVNLYGFRAEVSVAEAVREPEILEKDVPADVVAAADGIILDIQTSTGQPLFRDGDIVAEGEVLITGTMDLYEPEGSQVDQGYLVVHAAGTVTARTWRTLEESVPLTAWEKVYTGEEIALRSLRLLWGRFDFFQNSSISTGMYDKITRTEYLTLLGHTLPLGLTTAVVRPYTLAETQLDQDQAEARLRQALEDRLEQLLEPGEGKVLRRDFVTRVEDGVLTVTLLAECEEQIGRTVEREGETGRYYESRE